MQTGRVKSVPKGPCEAEAVVLVIHSHLLSTEHNACLTIVKKQRIAQRHHHRHQKQHNGGVLWFGDAIWGRSEGESDFLRT